MDYAFFLLIINDYKILLCLSVISITYFVELSFIFELKFGFCFFVFGTFKFN
jgi:hypothetical protein